MREKVRHERNLLQDIFLHAWNTIEEEEREDPCRHTERGAHGCDPRQEAEVVVAELGFGNGVAVSWC